MKIKRYKKSERYMTIYKNDFGFREPYQVLLDGTFCQVALAHKVNIQDQLPKYLSGQCKLLTTACVIEETKKLGKSLHGAHLIVSQYPLHDCGHEQPISASKCLSSFIIDSRNRDHYLLATQDHNLREKVSRNAVCPLIKLANNTLVLEKPTEKVLNRVSRKHHYLANKISHDEKTKAHELKVEDSLESILTQERPRKKKKGPKAPNPLSCRKKSKKVRPTGGNKSSGDEESAAIKKRRRKKVRIARHVVKLLKENMTDNK